MKQPTVSERLKAAIQESPESLRAIARETGVSASVTSRFIRGKTGIGIENVDALAAHLGLDLLPTKPAANRKGR